MTNEEIIKISGEVLAQTYGRLPVVLVKGQGCKVWDADGKEYLDFVAGIGVCNLGHCHPKVVQAIRDQAGRLLHVSNLYHIEPQVQLAKLLVEHSFADRVFFCNSGTEANEAAIKLARKYSHDHFGPNRYEIISLLKSFHGRTMASLAATGQEKFHKGFEPLMTGFKFVPLNDLEAMEGAVTDSTCAVLLEPIQAEGGVNFPAEGYLEGVRKLCERKKLLLIFDEVQAGMGRTGKLFAYEHYGVTPDIMTMAKGLAGGVPDRSHAGKRRGGRKLHPRHACRHFRGKSPFQRRRRCGAAGDARGRDPGKLPALLGPFPEKAGGASEKASFHQRGAREGAHDRHGMQPGSEERGERVPEKRVPHQLHERHDHAFRAAPDRHAQRDRQPDSMPRRYFFRLELIWKRDIFCDSRTSRPRKSTLFWSGAWLSRNE